MANDKDRQQRNQLRREINQAKQQGKNAALKWLTDPDYRESKAEIERRKSRAGK